MNNDDSDSPLNVIKEFLEQLKATPAGGLLDRADELRGRLLKVSVVFFLLFGAVVTFAKPIFGILKSPLVDALPAGQASLHFTDPLEVFMSYMKVGFLAATALVAPFGFIQIWRFIVPAIPERQKKYFTPFFTAATGLFYAGGAFCFFIILPPALKILLAMGGDVAQPLITVEEYISLVVMMMLGFGVVFQLPLVLIILERLGVIQVEHLANNRRAMVVAILVVAAIVTPTPDPFSQLAMATPMYLMFEAAIVIIRWMKRHDAKLPAAVDK